MAVFAYGKYFDDPAVLSYYHDTEFLKTAPLLRPSLAEERGRLTQTLTQTTQKMGGNNGADAPKEQLRPEQTGLSSHVCAYFCSLILILDRELQKSRSKRYKACSDVAETVGFEPTDRLITDQTISSRSRYDHFDTSPHIFQPVDRRKNQYSVVWKTVSILLASARKNLPGKSREALHRAGLRERGGDTTVWISSQPRYDHFDTAAEILPL